MRQLKKYLQDPFLKKMYTTIRELGPIKMIQLDLTHKCNLRCKGCYFFYENMDKYKLPKNESDFDHFVEQELSRGTNAILVTGGEPALELDRLRKLNKNMRVTCVTNGMIPIPRKGLEQILLAISVWGNFQTDTDLRGQGKTKIFEQALKNYKNDDRASWYYTIVPGRAHEIQEVVERCVDNGNTVSFNFYGDIESYGGELGYQNGFEQAADEIQKVIKKYPDKILLSSYMLDVITKRKMMGRDWGYENCCSLTYDHPENKERLANGRPYAKHLRIYMPNLKDTRKCCTGNARNCANCFDTISNLTWIIHNVSAHLDSKEDFTKWLTSMYLYAMMSDYTTLKNGLEILPEIHLRLASIETADNDYNILSVGT